MRAVQKSSLAFSVDTSCPKPNYLEHYSWISSDKLGEIEAELVHIVVLSTGCPGEPNPIKDAFRVKREMKAHQAKISKENNFLVAKHVCLSGQRINSRSCLVVILYNCTGWHFFSVIIAKEFLLQTVKGRIKSV